MKQKRSSVLPKPQPYQVEILKSLDAGTYLTRHRSSAYSLKMISVMAQTVAAALNGKKCVHVTPHSAKLVASRLRDMGYRCRAIGNRIHGKILDKKWNFVISTVKPA